jgi:SAM-dependent methyltransferase
MTLGHKLAKLFRAETWRRMWRRVERVIDPIAIRPLLARIDRERLEQLRHKHGAPAADAHPNWRHYAKYLDVKEHLPINVRRAHYLRLHHPPRRDILDIGCGAGFFLFVAQSLGHRGLGLDVSGVPLFDEMVELLGVDRKIEPIRKLQPLPDLGRRFDLITAFSPAFHGGLGTSWDWGAKEWDFLVSDLERHLKPGGRIFFGLNPAYNGEFYTDEILQLFLRRGAEVERENVFFAPKSA